MPHKKTEGPAENTHVIARSEATWQSRGSRNIPENRRDCHALRARNDVVIWWPVLLFGSGGHGGTARGPFRSTQPGQPTHHRRNGTSHRPPLSLRGRRPWQSVTPAMLCTARSRRDRRDADCHVGLCPPRNDVVIWWPVLLFGSGDHRGTARGPFPTVRIGPGTAGLPVGRFYSTAVK